MGAVARNLLSWSGVQTLRRRRPRRMRTVPLTGFASGADTFPGEHAWALGQWGMASR